MRLAQWNITVQRNIGQDMAVEAGYVGNRRCLGDSQRAGSAKPVEL